MASKEMYALGSQASVIRDLFAYGQQQAAVVGKENVFDFSIGNPTVPAPACVKEAIEDIMETRESAAIHGYTAAAGDTAVRQGLADFMNQTYDAQVRADNFYMTCGAAASLTISLKALVEKQKEQLDFYQQAPAVPQPHAKPRLALLLKLMERSGADIEKHGAKSKAARLAEYLTGLSIQTCKNFMSDPHLDTSTHAREIADCNEMLRQLDLDCQL